MEYEKINCSCGKQARIVISGVGVYITCPDCGLTTTMQSARDAAEEEWREIKCQKCEYYGRAADAPESVPKDCTYTDEDIDEDGFNILTPPCMRYEKVIDEEFEKINEEIQ